jgi:predicted acylesterase/phospholipase RssA
MMDASRKCRHSKCRCSVDGESPYCSASCADQPESQKTVCLCKHPNCYQECDVVMKGGVTSGVIYPPLVLKLKEAYRFRCVGGTSAGAIAAAATAVAEYGREARDASGRGGFEKLDELQIQLSQGTFLRDLFQPSRQTRPLMRFLFDLLDILKSKRPLLSARFVAGINWALLRELPLTFATGAVLGIGASWLVAWLVGGSLEGWGLVVPVVFGLLGAVKASLIRLVLLLLRSVPENLLGMCTGRKDDVKDTERLDVLTDWLNDRIDDLAGLDSESRPLTFGHLRTKPFGDDRDSAPAKEDNIILRMVTSNLSQNQPYVLPFRGHLFVFNKSDFSKLFPRRIVEYLVEHTSRFKEYDSSVTASHYGLPKDFYFLPDADDLPVIIATRMSLSFPVLLSAVPLYTIKPEKVAAAKTTNQQVSVAVEDLQINWFSDGGICSNFPIQFFDRWLPTRPTFGINLTSLPQEALSEDKSQVKPAYMSPTSSSMTAEPKTEAIYLPKPTDCLATEIIPFSRDRSSPPSLFKFLWAIFSTAQNYRDNAQSVLPSYRERIVQIRLDENEGGLNLAMPGPTIQNVIDKGEKAGQKLLREFHFDAHQWVRFRVLMKQIEESLTQMNGVMNKHKIYFDLVSNSIDPSEYPYPCDSAWLNQAASRLESMAKEIQGWKPLGLFANKPFPFPEPVLRVMPEL